MVRISGGADGSGVGAIPENTSGKRSPPSSVRRLLATSGCGGATASMAPSTLLERTSLLTRPGMAAAVGMSSHSTTPRTATLATAPSTRSTSDSGPSVSSLRTGAERS